MATKLKRRLLSFCLALSVAASLGMSAAAAEPSTEQDYLSLPHVGEIGPEIAPSNTYKNVDLDSELLSATGPDEVSSILKDRYIEKISSMSESELSEKLQQSKILPPREPTITMSFPRQLLFLSFAQMMVSG